MFGKWLRQERLAKGMGLRRFAFYIDVLPSELCEVENGEAPPWDRLIVYDSICEILEFNDDDRQHMLSLAGVADRPLEPEDIEKGDAMLGMLAKLLPPKFTEDERYAYQWLRDCRIAGWAVDINTKEVHTASGKYAGLIPFAESRGMERRLLKPQ